MKVLVVSPYPPKRDGIGEHTQKLVRALRAHPDVDVEVVTFCRPVADDPARDAADGVHRLLSARPSAFRSTMAMMRHTRPDVVHYQFAIPAFGLAGFGAIAAGLWTRRRIGTRLVFTFHEARREVELLRGVGRLLYRALVAIADGVVVHTEEVRDLVVGSFGADERVVWLTPLGAAPPAPESVEPRVLDEVRRRYGVDERPFALCFGYLHPDKGIQYLVEAAALLQRRSATIDRGLDVLVAGAVRPRSGLFRWFETKDHAYELQLRDAVERHGLGDQVRFVGFVPHDDVPALYAAARVVVVPFITVTQSSVLSTATVVGTPVIASDLPGLRETLGDGGILVPPRDPDALADALEAIASDDALVGSLRNRQRRRGAMIGLSNVAAELVGIYDHVVNSTRSVDVQVALDGR